jgi:hypothetical protein
MGQDHLLHLELHRPGDFCCAICIALAQGRAFTPQSLHSAKSLPIADPPFLHLSCSWYTQCLLELIEQFTHFGTIATAITGKGFIPAAKDLFSMLKRNFLATASLWWIPGFTLVGGCSTQGTQQSEQDALGLFANCFTDTVFTPES